MKSHLQRLLILQKRALRIINGLGPREHTASCFVRDSLLAVSDMHTVSSAVFLYRLKFNSYPTFLVEYFTNVLFPVTSQHSANTRFSARNLAPSLRCRTSLRQRTFTTASLRILNSIITPYGLFETPQSLKSFKRSISGLIIATYQ